MLKQPYTVTCMSCLFVGVGPPQGRSVVAGSDEGTDRPCRNVVSVCRVVSPSVVDDADSSVLLAGGTPTRILCPGLRNICMKFPRALAKRDARPKLGLGIKP